jgi:methyltransferase, FkbM family
MLKNVKKNLRKIYREILAQKKSSGEMVHRLANFILPDGDYSFAIMPSQPWQYVQTCVEKELYRFIPVLPLDKTINFVIVGAYTGDEVPRITANNKNLDINFFLYECDPDRLKELRKNFLNNPKIKIRAEAVGDKIGACEFYQTSLIGSASCLPLAVNRFTKTQLIENTGKINVEETTLDNDFLNSAIDILWIDVQGFEMNVLLGATEKLKSIRAVFIEVQHNKSFYEGGTTFEDVDAFLKKNEFSLMLLGIDPATRQGNALYVKI